MAMGGAAWRVPPSCASPGQDKPESEPNPNLALTLALALALTLALTLTSFVASAQESFDRLLRPGLPKSPPRVAPLSKQGKGGEGGDGSKDGAHPNSYPNASP